MPDGFDVNDSPQEESDNQPPWDGRGLDRDDQQQYGEWLQRLQERRELMPESEEEKAIYDQIQEMYLNYMGYLAGQCEEDPEEFRERYPSFDPQSRINSWGIQHNTVVHRGYDTYWLVKQLREAAGYGTNQGDIEEKVSQLKSLSSQVSTDPRGETLVVVNSIKGRRGLFDRVGKTIEWIKTAKLEQRTALEMIAELGLPTNLLESTSSLDGEEITVRDLLQRVSDLYNEKRHPSDADLQGLEGQMRSAMEALLEEVPLPNNALELSQQFVAEAEDHHSLDSRIEHVFRQIEALHDKSREFRPRPKSGLDQENGWLTKWDDPEYIDKYPEEVRHLYEEGEQVLNTALDIANGIRNIVQTASNLELDRRMGKFGLTYSTEAHSLIEILDRLSEAAHMLSLQVAMMGLQYPDKTMLTEEVNEPLNSILEMVTDFGTRGSLTDELHAGLHRIFGGIVISGKTLHSTQSRMLVRHFGKEQPD